MVFSWRISCVYQGVDGLSVTVMFLEGHTCQPRPNISPAVEGVDPKVPLKVFFSLDYLSMRSNESFQGGGCETLTLEHSEKSKMAAKMAAETKNHHNFTSI